MRSFKKQRKKKKKKNNWQEKMKGNIRNYNALSIYAFKGGFKRHSAKFDNGEERFMHFREALKGIMADLIMERHVL